MTRDFEERVQAAREANLALYLDDPSQKAAELLVLFERTVRRLRAERLTPPEQARRAAGEGETGV